VTAVTIKVRRDGLLLVRGPFTLLDADGVEIPVVGDDVVLCRCGRSADKPFCDRSHRQPEAISG
jgi:CDGSH-type Zn-finger protein